MKRTIPVVQVFITVVLLSSLFGCGEPKKPTEEFKPSPTKTDGRPTPAEDWDEEIRLSGEDAPALKAYNNAHAMIVGPDGTLHVVWSVPRGENDEIHYRHSTDEGAAWSNETVLASGPNAVGPDMNNSGANPALAVSGSDVYVVWRGDEAGGDKSRQGEIYFIRSSDSGMSWGVPARLTDAPGLSASASIAASGNNLYLIWIDLRSGNVEEVFYKVSRDGGETWSDDFQLTQTRLPKGQPTVAVSGSLVNVFWMDLRDGNWEIYYKRSTDAGKTWSEDVRFTFDEGISEVPTVAVEGENVYVAWEDSWDGPTEYDYEIYFRTSADGGANWSAPLRLTYAPKYSLDPSITVLGSRLYVVWQDRRDSEEVGRIPDCEVYYKYSLDGGAQWSDDIRLTNDPGNSIVVSVAVTANHVHVLWEEYRDEPPQIYYQRLPQP